MSHFTTIQTQIKDIAALRGACRELGFTLEENAVARGYGENKHKGEFVIKLKGPYDIAVNRQEDGTWGLTTDWWDGHVEREVGKGYGRLLQLYGVYKAQAEARKKGYTTRRQSLKDGVDQAHDWGCAVNKAIEVIVAPDGSLKIDAVGFQGADCEKATAFLEKALGSVAGKQKKPEFYRQAQRQQRVGG